MASRLERAFETRWIQIGGPEYEPEFRFHPDRRWRFDAAWPGAKIAVELEGGIFTNGRHVRGRGFEDDCIKYNTAALLGWRVFRITGRMLDRDPVGCLAPIAQAIKDVGNGHAN